MEEAAPMCFLDTLMGLDAMIDPEEEDGGNIGLHIVPAFGGAGELDDAWLDLRRALREGVVHRSPV